MPTDCGTQYKTQYNSLKMVGFPQSHTLKLLKRMAGTTRLELATSAVTV
jgi:hypothetical protein